VFTCSHVEEDEKTLVKLAKRMKKNNISVDIVAFGDLGDDNIKKLEAFNENVKGGDGSHILVVPPGPNLLSDTLITSPILAAEAAVVRPGMGGGNAEAGGGGADEFEFGVDPSMDPELALALRMSFEEEKARQERERKEREAKEGKEELQNIPEADENQPLLDQAGEPSGSKSENSPGQDDKTNKGNDGDKMDLA
jgi:26S proteasome regulatory subunit N10